MLSFIVNHSVLFTVPVYYYSYDPYIHCQVVKLSNSDTVILVIYAVLRRLVQSLLCTRDAQSGHFAKRLTKSPKRLLNS